MSLKPVEITQKDVSFSGEKVILNSQALAEDLVADEAGTIEFLTNQVAPIRASDISIGTDGRVSIDNAGFVDKLRMSDMRGHGEHPELLGWIRIGNICGNNCKPK